MGRGAFVLLPFLLQMKTNIKHYLFNQLWNTTRDILPYEVEIKSEFLEQEIDNNKFEELFPDVSLSTVALISNKLAESGIIISLQNLCDFKLTEAFEKSLMIFTIDLSQIVDSFRTHLISPKSVPKVSDENFEIKPIKWSNLLEISESESFNNKVKEIEDGYPDSVIYGMFNPWENVIVELRHKGFTLTPEQKEQIKERYLDFIETSDLSITVQEVIQEKLDDFKTLATRHILNQSAGLLKLGPNEGVTLKLNLEPIRLAEDFTIEESAGLLGVCHDHWICETNDLVLLAESKDIPKENHENYCQVEMKGDFFIFPNCQDNPEVDTTTQFYVIPMHRIDESESNSLLNHILSNY